MPAPNFRPSGEPQADAPDTPDVVTSVILLLVAPARVPLLRPLLRRLLPQAEVVLAKSPTDATAHLAQGGIDLLVLDLQFDGNEPLALIHLLARFAPSTALLAFAEQDVQPSVRPYELWSWDEAEAALRFAARDGGPIASPRLS